MCFNSDIEFCPVCKKWMKFGCGCEKTEESMEKWCDELVMKWSGKVMSLTGAALFVFTLFFDRIAGRPTSVIGWVQSLGLAGSFALFLFGVVLDSFMKTIEEMLNEK